MTARISGRYQISLLQKKPHRGGQPDESNSRYKLVVGGHAYFDDEIPANLSITMNAGGSGFSVGNLATMSISGTLPYYLNNLNNLSEIQLYQRGSPIGDTPIWNLRYEWRLKNATLTEQSSFTFSGVDAMAFTNNDYAIQWTDTKPTNPKNHYRREGTTAYDTIGTQVSSTIPTTLSSLSGMAIGVDSCDSETVNNLIQGDYQATKSIKSTLEEVAKFDASNYYVRCTGVGQAQLVKVQTSEILVTGDYSPLSVGQYNPPILGYQISGSDSNVEPYTYGNPSSAKQTMTVTAAFVDSLCQLIVVEGKPNQCGTSPKKRVEPTSYQALANANIGSGRQFTCQKAYVENMFESGQFLVPMSFVNFSQEVYSNRQFVLTSAQYYLTSEGIYASLSGSAKAVSDFEYVGTTAKRVRDKLSLNYDYGGTMFTQSGIVFDESHDTTQVDSG